MERPDRRQAMAWLGAVAFAWLFADGASGQANGKGSGNSEDAGGDDSGPSSRAVTEAGGAPDRAVAPDMPMDAVKRGEALPLRVLLPRIERRYRSEIIGASLQRVGRRLIYTLRMLSPGGRVFLVAIDAATGRPRPGF